MSWFPNLALAIVLGMSFWAYWTGGIIERSVGLFCATAIVIVIWLADIGTFA